MDLSSGGLGLFFEAHQEVEDILGPIASVHDIAGLDEMRLSPDPMEIVVDQPDLRILEDHEVFVIPVEVANGDDLFDPGPYARVLGSEAETGEGEKEKTYGFEGIHFLRHVLLSSMILESGYFHVRLDRLDPDSFSKHHFWQGRGPQISLVPRS